MRAYLITYIMIAIFTLSCTAKNQESLKSSPENKTNKQAQKSPTSFQENLVAARARAKLISIGAGHMQNGKIVNLAVSGKRRIDKNSEVSEADKWHIGSITKSMTATMIARLVEQGKMRWDMKITDVFKPEDIHPDWQDTTLEQLLTHTSGLKPNFPIKTLFIWPETKQELAVARNKAVINILSKPRTSAQDQFVYSNVGYTVAGVMAEKTTAKSWERLMREQVFEPLGLNSAGFGAPLPANAQPWGHRKAFGLKKIAINPNKSADNTPIMGPAGIVHMSLADLLRYGQAHLDGDKGRKTDYLKTETWQKLHTAYKNDYGFGWVLPAHREWAKGRAIWHNGSNTMWYALLAIAPNTDSVYAIVTNDGDRKTADKSFGNLLGEMSKSGAGNSNSLPEE